MRALVALAATAAGLLATAPQLAAHGSECLFARVSPGDGGDITVELSADVEGNPLIPDASQARGILAGALAVRIGEHRYRLEDLGALSFEERTQLAGDAPLPPNSDGSRHQLLTAVWHARLPGQTFSLVTPEHTPHDVLLWDAAGSRPPGAPRWMLLICGEESHPYALPAAAASASHLLLWLGALAIAIAVPVLGVLGARHRQSSAGNGRSAELVSAGIAAASASAP